MSISVLEHSPVDYSPRMPELPDAPGPWPAAWTARVPVVGWTRVEQGHTDLFLVNAPDGIVALDPGPPGGERMLAGASLHVKPAVDGGPILVDARGGVYRWAPGDSPQRVWDVGLPSTEISVAGPQAGRLLVHARGAVQLVDPAERKVLWRRTGQLGRALPHGDSFYSSSIGRKGPGLIRIGAADGKTRWELPGALELADEPFAVVNGHVWVGVQEEIRAFDIERGKEAARIRIAYMPVPSGVVDAQGRMHICNGKRYAVLDLCALGRELSNAYVRLNVDEPASISITAGEMLTADGRLVFADRFGGIYAARAGDEVVAERLRLQEGEPEGRPMPPALRHWGIAHGQLYVLTRDGQLSALRPA